MFVQPLACFLLTTLTASPATETQVEYQASARSNTNELGASIELPMPNPSLGVPEAIQIQLVTGLHGYAAAENLSPQFAIGNFSGVLRAQMSSDIPGIELTQYSLPQASRIYQPFDGTSDLRGPSTERYDIRSMMESDVLLLKGKSLDRLLRASDSSGKLCMKIEASFESQLSGLDMYRSAENFTVSVQVLVTYVYPSQSKLGVTSESSLVPRGRGMRSLDPLRFRRDVLAPQLA